MTVKVITVSAPEYIVDKKPDYLKIGKIVDRAIEINFSNQKYVYRAIGMDDHPALTLDKLVEIILELGTDKYDPKRKGVCHEQFSVYDYDIQAGTFEIRNSRIEISESDTYPTLFGDTIHDFYENAPHDRGYPVRIDILMIYNFSELEPARLIDPKSTGVSLRYEKYLYKFKDRKNKRNALLGIVKISR